MPDTSGRQDNPAATPNDGGPDLRAALTERWQSAALDLVQRGVPAVDVFETLMVVGLAGSIETGGKRAAAQRLLHLAEQLTDQIRREAAAVDEARRATKD